MLSLSAVPPAAGLVGRHHGSFLDLTLTAPVRARSFITSPIVPLAPKMISTSWVAVPSGRKTVRLDHISGLMLSGGRLLSVPWAGAPAASGALKRSPFGRLRLRTSGGLAESVAACACPPPDQNSELSGATRKLPWFGMIANR